MWQAVRIAAVLLSTCVLTVFLVPLPFKLPSSLRHLKVLGVDARIPRKLQDCEVINWAELCGRSLPAGKCFHVQSSDVVPSCRLQGPAAQSAARLGGLGGNPVTLQTAGALQISGNIRMASLRFEAKTLLFEDAQVEALHEPHNPLHDSIKGGVFSSSGALTFVRSNLTVLDSRAQDGGACWAGGNLTLTQSRLQASRTAASGAGGGLYVEGAVRLHQESELVIESTSAFEGGGFLAKGEIGVFENSLIRIEHGRAVHSGGGFATLDAVMLAAGRIDLRDTVQIGGQPVTNGSAAPHPFIQRQEGGGFFAGGKVLVSEMSRLSISNSQASLCGGFSTDKGLQVISSAVVIENATAHGYGGGFCSKGGVELLGKSNLRIETAKAGQDGGGMVATGEVVVAGMSTLSVANSHAVSKTGLGGGIATDKNLQVTSGSTLQIRNATAGQYGGGLWVRGKIELLGKSNLSIETAKAGQNGGGFAVNGNLELLGKSNLSIETAKAEQEGGGFIANGEVVVAGMSTLSIANGHAVSKTGRGGGFFVSENLQVTGSSTLQIFNATAGSGGGFFSQHGLTADRSTIAVSGTRAEVAGGGFYAGLASLTDSKMIIQDATAGGDGGGFTLMLGLTLKNGTLVVRNSTALGSAGLVHGPLMVSSFSRVVLQCSKAGKKSSVLAASCLQLDPHAAVLLQDVAGGHGLRLGNDACSSACSNGTFQVDSRAALNATGRLSLGLLSMQTCQSETVRLSGIHLHSWSGPLLSTSPRSVVIDDVTIDYKPPLSNLEIVAAKDHLRVDSLALSCIGCGPHGVAVSGTRRALHVRNPEGLQCPSKVRVTNDSTSPCTCTDYQTTSEHFRGAEVVSLQHVLQTCSYCEHHRYYQNGECLKCAPYNAWSVGKSDTCHPLPQTRAMRMTIVVGATVFVLLVFIFFQVLQAPLVVVDARSDMAKGNPIASEKMLMISVQGPIVDLPKSISRLVHWLIYYRAAGTGLQWLDFDPEKANAVKVSGIARRKVEVQNLKAPFGSAACQGCLHPMQTGSLFAFLCAVWSLAVLLPVTIYVAQISGNGVEHTMVTVAICVLPIGLTAALLHPLVAWLIRVRYQATPFSEALNEYRKQILHERYAGPDATHPQKQGLMVMTLHNLWEHFDSFILNRNMHFIVANIVTPLTRKKEVSFVALWGGRPVDYFVSHSWGTSFSHFVSSIRCHAVSKEGQVWMDASYWICSFANNQWNIQEEVGTTIMDSSFARALRGGIKGVVMVLDHEVQPLTRVWCLFEFLLSSREDLELVFGTDLGVIGDDGCTSFDIALEAGTRIKTLKVANCEASSDKDKTIIFDYIISELGSLEHMDEQIRSLMGQMLKKNLANVGAATTKLLQELGQELGA